MADRRRVLFGASDVRRASHAGFSSAPMIDPDLLRRRASLPATFERKADKSRDLHRSSAAIDIIREFRQIKIVNQKLKLEKTLHPMLQECINQRGYFEVDPDEDEEEQESPGSPKKSFSHFYVKRAPGCDEEEERRTARSEAVMRSSSDLHLCRGWQLRSPGGDGNRKIIHVE